MACPWFEPSDPLPRRAWPGKYRPPLGRLYGGSCRAQSDEVYKPSGDLLLMGCNLGYARGQCQRLPATGPDAVRFCLQDSGGVRWSIEKAHAPVAVGQTRRGRNTGQGIVLDRQVEAYFEACETASDRSR